ncbi:TPA: glycosyltransferase family 4 protein [Serratia marcescens]|uniref:glycosyltransferase family 4 protein n=1 Tax=Serratia TaxID=613 RepID=UPI001A31DECA|nr:glycosyltransferase family 4 protein [Serratia marcescens]HAT4975201.1 glycosyltransferase family 4 protein [Serratia marcescens]HAT4986999.1 glycosyltransferase family 4 protein [Serratia marcescens]HAT5049385.1 glycosyltransferase family 4 protein [Serratia marcescens]HEJ7078692.1 glycosyltransferase family 4 protein [Serratia marcescens]
MIYINARFLTQDMTGVQRFAEQISRSLNGIRNDIVFLVPDEKFKIEIDPSFEIKVIGKKHGHLWEQIDLPKYLKSIGSPPLLNLCSTAPLFYRNQIVTHHDITYKRYPESFSRQFRYIYNLIIPIMLKNSRKIITVSEFSKGEIAKAFNVEKEKISVVYNASSANFKSIDSGKQEKYLLAVSSPNYHKNFHGMLKAFAMLDDKIEIKLKIIGRSADNFNKQMYANAENTNSNIEFLGRVDDLELVKLYQNATAFVFPSFYEGFGIPPLEAQSCGCPVIASSSASIPEVLGTSALYFDPYKIDEIAKAMETIIGNDTVREELIRLGFENTRRFSWEKSAQAVNKIISQYLE